MDTTEFQLQNVKAGMAVSLELVNSDEWQNMVDATSDACAKFFNRLVAAGIPSEQAGQITAAYVSAIASGPGAGR